MYSLNSIILLSIYLYFKKRRKAHQVMSRILWKKYEKNIIKFYSCYYITSALHKIKTTIKFYLNLFFIIFFFYPKNGEKLIKWWAVYYEKNIIKYYISNYTLLTLYEVKILLNIYLNFYFFIII